MGRGVKIPFVGLRYTMDRGFDIPCVGGVRIPRVGNPICHGKEFIYIPWERGQNTMGTGFDIPWVGGSTYHG